jgi:cell division septation protein DedD
MHCRQKVLFPRVVWGENNLGVVLNISQSGLALQADAELIDDELPNMRFQFSGSQARFEAKGRIAWRSDSKKLAGVEFIDLSAEARKQIQIWIFLTSDASEFPKTDAPTEKTEQVNGAMATSEAIPFPEPKIVELVPEDRSQHSIFPLVQSPAETQVARTVSENAMAANVTSGSGKAVRLVGLSLAVVLFLLASLSVRDHLQKAGTSQKARETIAEPNLPGFSSKVSATPTYTPGPAVDPPAFVFQVGAMAHEENAKALAESLSQMHFPAFVFKRPTDRFHRVLVGPYNGVEAALRAKTELEKQGFQAIRTAIVPVRRFSGSRGIRPVDGASPN